MTRIQTKLVQAKPHGSRQKKAHGNGLQQEGGDEHRHLIDINAKGKQRNVQEGKRQRNKPGSMLRDKRQWMG